MPHGLHRGPDDFLAAHPQFVVHVDVGGGDEGVDAGMGGVSDGLPGPVDIAPGGAGQAGHLHPLHFGGDLRDGLEVTLGSRRESGLDDIDAELFQLHGQPQFFAGVHAGAGGLLPVPQGRVENDDAIVVAVHG